MIFLQSKEFTSEHVWVQWGFIKLSFLYRLYLKLLKRISLFNFLYENWREFSFIFIRLYLRFTAILGIEDVMSLGFKRQIFKNFLFCFSRSHHWNINRQKVVSWFLGFLLDHNWRFFEWLLNFRNFRNIYWVFLTTKVLLSNFCNFIEWILNLPIDSCFDLHWNLVSEYWTLLRVKPIKFSFITFSIFIL